VGWQPLQADNGGDLARGGENQPGSRRLGQRVIMRGMVVVVSGTGNGARRQRLPKEGGFQWVVSVSRRAGCVCGSQNGAENMQQEEAKF
jgi:hypothetical protein